MPRMTGDEARAEVEREMEARWRYVLRHPDFRKDVRQLRALYRQDQNAAVPVHQQLIEKWRLKEIPFDILTKPYIPDHPPYKNAYYETICPQATVRYPVEAHDLSDRQLPAPNVPRDLKPGHSCQITVDLSYPDYLLLHMIGAELRAVRGEETRSRHHREKTDDYLEVYDRAEMGQTFETIAAALGESVSTIKSRLRAACSNIYGPDSIPPKWRLKLASFDASTHLATCPQCGTAVSKENPSEEDFCPRARQYISEETVGQRELSCFDTVRDTGAHRRAFNSENLPED